MTRCLSVALTVGFGLVLGVALAVRLPDCPAKAYDLMVARHGSSPRREFGATAEALGPALGKSSAQVGDDVRSARMATARAARAFTLHAYRPGRNGSLADYRERVVLVDGNRYDFFPLRATEDVVKAYGVRGYPANFLVDRAGRIVFTPRLHDDKTQAILEAQIEELLNRSADDARSAGAH